MNIITELRKIIILKPSVRRMMKYLFNNRGKSTIVDGELRIMYDGVHRNKAYCYNMIFKMDDIEMFVIKLTKNGNVLWASMADKNYDTCRVRNFRPFEKLLRSVYKEYKEAELQERMNKRSEVSKIIERYYDLG